ncbi:Uncharacterised protein [Mycobacteroides abscessus subsp. abscessus]|nr:Uncharacterised protein [Mycobacteroides abscessus subsp. abscessus]
MTTILVSVALGSTDRAAWRACLRRSTALGTSASVDSNFSSSSTYAARLASVALRTSAMSSGSSSTAGGSTTFESSSGTNRWESCEYEKWRCRINSWVQDREIPVM